MADFHPFAVAVNQQFVHLSKGELFTTEGEDDLFEVYLMAFPAGTDPIFRTNTEHHCSCCKNFIRNLGGLVSLVGGTLRTVWDVKNLPYPYDVVADKLATCVRARSIKSIYRTKEPSYGAEFTRETLPDGGHRRWNHFFGKVAKPHFCPQPDTERGQYDAKLQVFTRGLEELTVDALNQVLALIEDKALYRGEEHEHAVKAFRTQRLAYQTLTKDAQRLMFRLLNATAPAAQFRNTAIGTLVQDLSAGVDVEQAVKSFETKVAPTNYKRPTALITPRMVQDAMKTITSLGLEPALERRLATIADVSVNDVLWVSSAARSKMKAGLGELLMSAAKHLTRNKQADVGMPVERFIQEVLPAATGLRLHLQHQHLGNLMTLTAPVHDCPSIFKWGNNFAWSYAGNVTDSIRELVKKAGGNVDAKLRFSLSWFNYDDLDFHVKCPDGHIYFGTPYVGRTRILDVDMNAGGGTTRTPVENLSFVDPKDGLYDVFVNQFSKRETSDVGFAVEIAHAGGVTQMSYKKAVPARADVMVGHFTVKNGTITNAVYGTGLEGGGVPQTKWGVTTEAFVEVSTLMLSPNCWGDHAIGNKHWFFVLKDCVTDEPVRGIYNEFLKPELEKHRKVFEVLGDKTKCPVAADQLSGLGFSSTRNDSVTLEVTSAAGVRNYTITF